MFVDRVRIRVTGGAGGNGCCSFRREKYVPRGGPDGGDGGHGGDVFFVASPDVTSLIKLRYHAHWKGESGNHGQGSNRHGKTGTETVIPVPVGTLVRDLDTGEVRCDLAEPGERFCAARGGRGGKGNARFATSTRRIPRFAELGEPGEEAQYLLELKLIAEVGLVGLPNAGKSTLLSVAQEILLGSENVSNIPWQSLSDRFKTAELFGKLANIFADLPSKSVDDLELKSVKKKYKTPAFAAGCSREVIQKGADMLGWELDDLISRTILAMRSLNPEAGI